MTSLTFELIRSRRKTVSIIVHHTGQVVVRAPLRLSEKVIREFVEGKRAWITAKQAELARQQPSARQFAPGEMFLYLGQSYPLTVTSAQRPALRLTEAFELSRAALPRARQTFERWYRAQAAKVISQRAALFAAQFGLRYQSIRISAARTRWGSCSSKGALSFTWRLVMAPLEIIDYVVVHELAHLVHHNHSPAFWAQVETMLLDYRARRAWLKKYGHTLTLD
ncbi:MAG: SprT family zinc-dependent metalloprotease [Anaerolineales bacterium]